MICRLCLFKHLLILPDGRSQSDRLQAVRQHVFPRLRHVLGDRGGRRQGRGAGGGRLPHVAVLVSGYISLPL
jgi:hypothetical protein